MSVRSGVAGVVCGTGIGSGANAADAGSGYSVGAGVTDAGVGSGGTAAGFCATGVVGVGVGDGPDSTATGIGSGAGSGVGSGTGATSAFTVLLKLSITLTHPTSVAVWVMPMGTAAPDGVPVMVRSAALKISPVGSVGASVQVTGSAPPLAPPEAPFSPPRPASELRPEPPHLRRRAAGAGRWPGMTTITAPTAFSVASLVAPTEVTLNSSTTSAMPLSQGVLTIF